MGSVQVNIRPAINNRASDVENGRAADWSLRLIGGFELTGFLGAQRLALPGKRERALLAFLALSPKGRQPRRKLAALLWGDATDETLLDNLRTCVWRLRKALGDTEHRVLASDEEEIVLDMTAFQIDVLEFRRLAAQPGRAELEAAVRLSSGELLAGLELDSEEFESWRRLEISRHLDQSVEVSTRLLCLLRECGESERALELGSQVLGLDPLHEATARHMMRLYADSGRRGAAIHLYKTLSEALQREVSTQPEAETRQIFDAIMQTNRGKDSAQPWSPDDEDATFPSTAAQEAVPNLARMRRIWMAAFAAACIAFIVLASYWQASLGQPNLVARKEQQNAPDNRIVARSRPLSIAVLPFDNLSGDPGQQYFSDGMTEEISTALAKVSGVELIARTSAFQFRANKDARQVGASLGARYVLEGTVRKMDNRVRITAELVRTDSGRQVWSNTYERQLTDVFVIQEDIAKAIASELRLSIALPSGENLVSSRDIDPNDYEQFLRVRSLLRARMTGIDQAIPILEQLVARHPRFAPAWGLLAHAYTLASANSDPYTMMPGHPGLLRRGYLIETYRPKAEEAARRAIQLDARLPEGYYALGQLMSFRGRWGEAEDLYAKALALDPYNPDALGLQINLLAETGQIKKATGVAEKLLALDPYVPTWKQDAAEIFWAAGQKDRAVQMLQSILERPSVPYSLAMIYSADGHYGEAADIMDAALKVRGELPFNQTPQWRAAITYLRTAPAKVAAGHDLPVLGRVDWVYLYVGAPEYALLHYERDVRTGLFGGPPAFGWLWNPAFAVVRNTARFKALMKSAGFVDYWQQRGWADSCHPLGSSDFECH